MIKINNITKGIMNLLLYHTALWAESKKEKYRLVNVIQAPKCPMSPKS